jgi:hypothetical protein
VIIAKEAINLAAWLRFKEKGELNPQLIALSKKAIDSASMNAIERAQIILKNYPNLIPKVDVTELKWPDETKTKWIQIFGCEPPAPQCWSSELVPTQEVDDILKWDIRSFKTR